jgi:hypothetical protein
MLGAGLGCIDSRFENEANPNDRADGQAALLNAKTRNLGMWSAEDALCAYEFRRLKNAK